MSRARDTIITRARCPSWLLPASRGCWGARGGDTSGVALSPPLHPPGLAKACSDTLLQPVPPGLWFLSHKPFFLTCFTGFISLFFFSLPFFYYFRFENNSKSLVSAAAAPGPSFSARCISCATELLSTKPTENVTCRALFEAPNKRGFWSGSIAVSFCCGAPAPAEGRDPVLSAHHRALGRPRQRLSGAYFQAHICYYS